MYTYAHTLFDEETIKLTRFSPGGTFFAFIRGVYCLKSLTNFFTKQMSFFFRTLIDQGFALVYIDDILLLSKSKEQLFKPIEQFNLISSKHQNVTSKLLRKSHSICYSKSVFLDTKLVITLQNPFTDKLLLFTKFHLLLVKLPLCVSLVHLTPIQNILKNYTPTSSLFTTFYMKILHRTGHLNINFNLTK